MKLSHFNQRLYFIRKGYCVLHGRNPEALRDSDEMNFLLSEYFSSSIFKYVFLHTLSELFVHFLWDATAT